MAKLSIIIPSYQVEKNIPVTVEALFALESEFQNRAELEYVFVDDGSIDGTFAALTSVKQRKGRQVKIVKLARNFGSNAAAMAGLEYATGDCAAFFSADLQDPPELLIKMFDYWSSGIKVVVCNRQAREEPLTRRLPSWIYHSIMRVIMPIRVPRGGFDMVMFDRQVQNRLVEMKEKNLYLPYLIMWLGFDYISIPYTRRKREIGVSAWTFSKKVKAAIDSIVGFSFFPIRAISVIGISLGLFSLFYLALVVYRKLMYGNPVDGWTSMMVVVLGVSSFQMFSLGIIGEYVWRALDAARARPNFIIDKVIE